MPAHPDFTARFAQALRSSALPPGVTGPDADLRFAVYRNNVAHSLRQALAARFPVIERLVGEAYFTALAGVYLDQSPPASPVLLGWGATFPAFLAGFEPLAAYPYLADVARVEYARGLAFHAADAPLIDPAALTGADPAQMRLALHPSVQMIRLQHPAVSIWAANQPGAQPGPLPAGPEIALILRNPDYDVPVSAITPGDAALLEALAEGAPLLVAAETAQAIEPGHDAGRLLIALMRSGAFCPAKDRP